MGKWKVLKRAPLNLRPSPRSLAKADTQIKGLIFSNFWRVRGKNFLDGNEVERGKEKKGSELKGRRRHLFSFSVFSVTEGVLPKHHEMRML